MVKTAPVRLVMLAPVSRGRLLVAVDGEVAPVEAALARGIAEASAELHDALFLADLHPSVPLALQPEAPREVHEALGLIETRTAAAAIRAADAGLKAAEVSLLRLHLANGIGGKGFLQLTGTVAAVEAGVASAVAAVEVAEFLVSTEIIPSLHGDLRAWLGRRLSRDVFPFDGPPGE
jgi:microcompartment protein CcmL/EutN